MREIDTTNSISRRLMMKMLIGAIALAIAVPAAAQAAPAEHKMECCEKAEGKECCCKGMAKKDHDMKQDHQPKADGADHKDHGEHAH